MQRNTATRDSYNAGFATQLGTTPTLTLLTGTAPAATTTADTGTALVVMTLPNPPLGSSSAGVISKSGTWSGTGAAAGTAGYYRLKNGATVIEQGTVAIATTVATSALTAANGNVLTFASAPAGVVVGQTISGTGVPSTPVKTLVAAIVGATIVMSQTSTAGVASGANITFSADMALDNTVIAISQAVTVNTYSSTAGDA